MLKRITLICAALSMSAGAALAQDASSMKKDCFDSAFSLAQSAIDKKLSEDRLDEVEAKIMELEGLCDSDEFEAAKATAKEIESEISGS